MESETQAILCLLGSVVAGPPWHSVETPYTEGDFSVKCFLLTQALTVLILNPRDPNLISFFLIQSSHEDMLPLMFREDV